jgi:uncharacterized protein (TIGR01777 family)
MAEGIRPVLVSGASGLVGGALLRALRARGERVRALTRDPTRLRPDAEVEAVRWNGLDVPTTALAGARAVVHLAGEPIFGGLPSAARRERIRASRVDSTRRLAEAVARIPAADRPEALVCASAVGYYGDRGEELLDEGAAPGSGFLAGLCVDWEAAAAAVEAAGLRRVSLRFGVVLSRQGGALALMAPIFRLGLGGRLGSGRQWMPWVHLDDAVGLALHALDDGAVRGAVNAVAPETVRNASFTRALARALRRPALLPVPALAVRLALGEVAGELLGSRRVTPARARAAGYRFERPELAPALEAELAA